MREKGSGPFLYNFVGPGWAPYSTSPGRPYTVGNAQIVKKASLSFMGLGATHPSVVALVRLWQESFNVKPAL